MVVEFLSLWQVPRSQSNKLVAQTVFTKLLSYSDYQFSNARCSASIASLVRSLAVPCTTLLTLCRSPPSLLPPAPDGEKLNLFPLPWPLPLLRLPLPLALAPAPGKYLRLLTSVDTNPRSLEHRLVLPIQLLISGKARKKSRVRERACYHGVICPVLVRNLQFKLVYKIQHVR